MLFREERLQQIIRATREDGEVSVAELSRRFGISEVTVRRDLRDLAERGLLRRAHGGALQSTSALAEPPVVQRLLKERDWKESIGRAAAALVGDGQSAFIGSGSTTAYVARNLVERKGLTVITNAINVATELAQAPGVTVVLTGGMMRSSELSLVGHIAEQTLHEVRVDTVIIGMRAVSLEAGLTNDYLPEVMTDRAIIDMARTLVLVADHTKFGQVASAYVAPLERVTTLVTDPGIDPGLLARLRDKGIQVIVAE